MGIIYTPKKFKYNSGHYYGIKKGSYLELARAIHADLYPRIWDLVNNKKYFRMNKKYDVLYAMENAQHVFYLHGAVEDNAGGLIFMTHLCHLLQKGRLKRHVYFEDIDERLYISINITPYINIRLKRNSEKQDPMRWHYNIYTVMQTMGFNSHLSEKYRAPSITPEVQMFETFRWNVGQDFNVNVVTEFSKKNSRYGKFWIMPCTPVGYYGGQPIETTMRYASGWISLSFGRFDIFTYRFLRYLKHINSHMEFTAFFRRRKTMHEYILHAVNGNCDLKLNTWE